MNIPDRERVYREFRRMLRPGGKLAFFAFYDVLAADASLELHFPVDIPRLRWSWVMRVALVDRCATKYAVTGSLIFHIHLS